MEGPKLRLLLVCAIILMVSAPAVRSDWDPGDGHKMKHGPQLPDPSGFDVCLFHQALTDDFVCGKSGPITDIHIWFSFEDDQVDAEIDWQIALCSDNAGEPGTTLWQYVPGQAVLTMRPYEQGLQDWYCPSSSLWSQNDHEGIYQVNITEIPEPAMQTQGDTYWLVVQAQCLSGGGPVGWKTSTSTNGNPALWYYSTPFPHWTDIELPPGGTISDLAFVITSELDFGDAPDKAAYCTLLTADGARHIVDGATYLGGPPDVEPDGQPNTTATGDDTDADGDDEDGVTFPWPVAQGDSYAPVDVVASQPGLLNAWMDFNDDGDWADPCEQIFTNTALSAGTNNLTFAVPGSATVGVTFARFRFDTTGGLSYTGLAMDGEVEDHEVTIGPPLVLDFGDAPDPCYPTLLANNGARHIIGGPWLGDPCDGPDQEGDGQIDPDALGDDDDGNDDEDGVTIPTLIQGIPTTITIEVSDPATTLWWLDLWIDYNGDGDWNDPCENLINMNGGGSVLLNLVGVTAPATSVIGQTFARCRISSSDGIGPTGLANGGEVEDYKVYIEEDPIKIKWSQPPTYNPGSQYPECFWGWDQMSVSEWECVADDWLCEDYRPVSGIHWWGSYVDWDTPERPQPAPIAFGIYIWTDVAADDPCNMFDFSHPGEVIWSYSADMNDVNEEHVGCDFHPDFMFMSGPDACFKYDLQLPEDALFCQEGGETVYWLSIIAVYGGPPSIEHYWGWKTRRPEWNDAAVIILDWGYNYLPIENAEGSWDMAFELTTNSEYCCNCGDFDRNGTIEFNDLCIVAENWLWTGTPGGYNAADLNCDGEVDFEDFAIFALQWLDSCP